jgi:SAM-dependent methyltransferase
MDGYYGKWSGLNSSRMRYWYNQQLAEADSILQSSPNIRVLEIGVGTGTEFLWWALRGAEIVGIDAFEHCVATAAERLDVLERSIGRRLNATPKVAPLLNFEDSAGFDLIWMEQAFHHLEPRAAVVERIAKLLRPGGRVVLSEANALNPFLQLQLFMIRGLKLTYEVPSPNGTVIWGNERVLWRGALARWFRKFGVEEELSRYYRLFPSHSMFDSLFGMEKHVTSSWLAPLYTHYNFVGRKALR